ncbi:MAG: DUF6443 domain-containing protein [Bacteroidetes bacterium]|nr:DUF6443 domain-containing protein [Bacteroidota bacterium]
MFRISSIPRLLVILLVSFLTNASISKAQYPDIIYMNKNMIGDATIVARTSVIHQLGFKVKAGVYYHAYIDPNFQGSGLGYDPPPTPGGQTVTPSDRNYIITYIPQIEAYMPSSSYTCDKVNVDITYFDGLGRQLQDVSVMASPDQKDMIKYHTYDDLSRKDKEYLPYESPSGQKGEYDNDYEMNQQTFIGAVFGNANKNFGYSQSRFEESPLNRIVKQSAPGVAWALNDNNPGQEHVVAFSFETNSDDVNSWKSENNTLTPVTDSANQLFVNVKKNENQGTNSNQTGESAHIDPLITF